MEKILISEWIWNLKISYLLLCDVLKIVSAKIISINIVKLFNPLLKYYFIACESYILIFFKYASESRILSKMSKVNTSKHSATIL